MTLLVDKSLIPKQKIVAFQRKVWKWYKTNRRDLPWRKTQDPYSILVSEIMLQQTQVIRVIPKYEAFLKKFPTIKTLAQASTRDILVHWQGLGYNRRALALKKAAEQIQTIHAGVFPSTPEGLMELPGIGPYTARAVLAFAYNQPVVCIETNIRRVFIHEFFPSATAVTDRDLLPIIEKAVDHKNPREWYYALMDYGAMLASQVENPNRRSKHYVRQSKFKGSQRQVRGEILRALSTLKTCSIKKLQAACQPDPEKFTTALSQLQKEGFIQVKGSRVSLV